MLRSIVTLRCTLEETPCVSHSLYRHSKISVFRHLKFQRTPCQASVPTADAQVHKMVSIGGLQDLEDCSEHRGTDQVLVDKKLLVEVVLDTRVMAPTGPRRTMTMKMTLIQDSTISTVFCRRTRRLVWKERVDPRMDRLLGITVSGGRWMRRVSPRSSILHTTTDCMAVTLRCQSK